MRDLVGPISYSLAVGLSLISGLASIVVIVVVAAYFTINASQWRAES
ncbi:MAG TPA: hypothetical protein VE177_07500 [Candidatus Binatus sp.]|nr:hypothetical protein [Candidatus Binatus sp.]